MFALRGHGPTLERETRANLVYRAFTRIGDEKVPDAKTLARLNQSK